MSRKNKPVQRAGGGSNPVGSDTSQAEVLNVGMSDCLTNLALSFSNMGEDLARVLQSLTVEELPTQEQIAILDGVRVACNVSADHADELASLASDVEKNLPLPLPVVSRVITS